MCTKVAPSNSKFTDTETYVSGELFAGTSHACYRGELSLVQQRLRGGDHPFLFENIDFEIAIACGRCAKYATFETKFGQKFHSGAAWGAATPRGAKISI